MQQTQWNHLCPLSQSIHARPDQQSASTEQRSSLKTLVSKAHHMSYYEKSLVPSWTSIED
eukprot:4879616-Amphidinium_carterae.6